MSAWRTRPTKRHTSTTAQAAHMEEPQGATYIHHDASTEAGAAVEPVIVPELVDFDALPVVGRRGDQCHSRGERLARLRQGRQHPPERGQEPQASAQRCEALAGGCGTRSWAWWRARGRRTRGGGTATCALAAGGANNERTLQCDSARWDGKR